MKDVYEGLGILLKYGENEMTAGHDVIWAGPREADMVSPEDRIRLGELGWFIDGEYDCWSTFV